MMVSSGCVPSFPTLPQLLAMLDDCRAHDPLGTGVLSKESYDHVRLWWDDASSDIRDIYYDMCGGKYMDLVLTLAAAPLESGVDKDVCRCVGLYCVIRLTTHRAPSISDVDVLVVYY